MYFTPLLSKKPFPMTLFQRSRIRNQISCLLPAVNKENPSRARPLLRSPRCPLYSQREGRPLWCKLRGDRYRTATRSGSNEGKTAREKQELRVIFQLTRYFPISFVEAGPPEGEKIRFTSTSPSDENLKSELKSSGSPRRTAKIAFTCDRCGKFSIIPSSPPAHFSFFTIRVTVQISHD